MTIYPKSMSRVCYTYMVTFTHPETGVVKKYYGSRTAKGCHPDDFFNPYPTSSDEVIELLAEHGKDAFTYEIHDTFGEDILSCLHYESQMIKWLDAVRSPDWFNRHDGQGAFSTAGRNWSESNRAKRKKNGRKKRGPNEKLRGRVVKDSTRRLIAAKKVGKPLSELHKKAIAYGGLGRVQTEDTKNKISKNHGRVVEYSFIDPNGVVHEGRYFSAFCVEHKLHRGLMSKLRRGLIQSYKDWKLKTGPRCLPCPYISQEDTE